MTYSSSVLLPRLVTGVPGLDEITLGGLPAGSVTLVEGTSGSGKTVLATHFLAAGTQHFDQAAVFVTFTERPEKIRRFVGEFGWPIADWERQGRWTFVDASAGFGESTVVVGENLDFTVLLTRVTAAVERTGAQRVALDSLMGLFAQVGERAAIRDGLIRLTAALERLGVTAVVTLERESEPDAVGRFAIEEFVADNVVILRNTLFEESRRRTIEVLKLRGTAHRCGEFPFAITREQGLVVIPLSIELGQPSSTTRISTGIADLDTMLGGGLFRDSVTLVSGSTGSGKTSIAMHFAVAGAAAGEPAVIVGFEESRDQVLRGIAEWGVDTAALEEQGLLRLLYDYPETRSFEEHLVRLKGFIERWGIRRVAIDSLSTLRRAGPNRSFREFVIGLTAYLKEREVAGLVTTAQSTLDGTSATAEHVSALCDTIVMLRYVEMYSEIRRGIAVLKHRGSMHEKTLREFTIDERGVHIGAPFRTTSGILAGRPTQLAATERALLHELFPEEHAPRTRPESP